MKRVRVAGAIIAGGIGVLGAVWMVGADRERTERNLAESRGEAPIEPYDDVEGAPGATTRGVGGAVGARAAGGTAAQAGDARGAEGATGQAGGEDEKDEGSAERAARAQAVARAADDATRASRGTERDRAISRDDVVEAMAAVKPLMKRCYEQMLDDFPEADGRVTAKFTVRAEEEMGEVDVVEFLEEDAQFDAKMKGCMVKALDAFTIPMTGVNQGELTVSYPFTFSTKD